MSENRENYPQVIGPWTITRRLGSGGIGQVFEGVRGAERAAIKVLHPWLAENREFRNRFAQEVKNLGGIQHPNLSRYIDSDLESTQPWLAMELIEGPTLEQHIERSGPLSPEQWAFMAREGLEALKVLREHKIAHRDIKPSNILLALRGPVIIDFSISQMPNDPTLTQAGQIAGTPAWLSPEQVLAKSVTPLSDLFAFGTVLAYGATGRNPWGIESSITTVQNIVDGQPDLSRIPNLSQLRLITQLLDPIPKNRIPTKATIDAATSLNGRRWVATTPQIQPAREVGRRGNEPRQSFLRRMPRFHFRMTKNTWIVSGLIVALFSLGASLVSGQNGAIELSNASGSTSSSAERNAYAGYQISVRLDSSEITEERYFNSDTWQVHLCIDAEDYAAYVDGNGAYFQSKSNGSWATDFSVYSSVDSTITGCYENETGIQFQKTEPAISDLIGTTKEYRLVFPETNLRLGNIVGVHVSFSKDG